MKQFFSATSEKEEDMIIEKYSNLLNSQRKDDNVLSSQNSKILKSI
jgi:hypothetical protein